MFDTKDKINAAISAFTTLLGHPGWLLIQQILDENLKVLQEQLENGAENETTADVNRIRDRIALTRSFKNTPTDMLKRFQTSEPLVPDSDPYETVDQLRERKSEENPEDSS